MKRAQENNEVTRSRHSVRNLPHITGAHEWVFLSASVLSNTNLPRTERQSCNATVLGCEVVCWAEPYLLDSGIRLERKLSGSYYLLGWATPNRVTVIIVVVVNSIHSCVLVGSAPCSSS